MRMHHVYTTAGMFAVLALVPVHGAVGQERNPCAAAKNPCAVAKNPCVAGAMNACAAGQAAKMIVQGDRKLNMHGKSESELVALGSKLWKDKTLSGAGTTSCATCHQDGSAMMNPSFSKPYPHAVQMASDRFGLEKVNAAEMVQMCMIVPMNAKPLDWGAVELAALTAKVKDVQKGYKAGGMNPCAAGGMNPCAAGAKNPCAAGARNPCGVGGH